MTAMADAFKKNNPRWDRVAMVVTGRDMTERTEFGRAFPNATMFKFGFLSLTLLTLSWLNIL